MKKRDLALAIILILVLLLGILIYKLFFIKIPYNKNSLDSHSLAENNVESVVNCALNLYNEKKSEGIVFSSQCLGSCLGYAVDIVHVPRTSEDNKVENQCEDYRNGKLKHFIELDKDGNIVRIV